MTQEIAPVTFELELEIRPVNLKKKDGTVRECELRELTGFERDKYLESQKYRAGSNKSVKDFTDVMADLIVLALWDKATGEKVPKMEIRDFPSKTQSQLYKMINEMCGFEDGKSNKEGDEGNS